MKKFFNSEIVVCGGSYDDEVDEVIKCYVYSQRVIPLLRGKWYGFRVVMGVKNEKKKNLSRG